MTFLAVSCKGVTKLIFVPQGVKVKAKNYLEHILKLVIHPLNWTMFNGGHWTFQQDSAPAHKAKIVKSG